jgi:hypothetical protein
VALRPGVESDDAIRTTCSPNQCHIPRPYPVSLLETEEGHDQMGIAQRFDKFGRDWNYDACVVVSAMAHGAARTA